MSPRVLLSVGRSSPETYAAALRAAGCQVKAGYLPEPDRSCHGLVLAGGGDLHPALFGQADRGSRNIDRDRDRAELALLDTFLGAGRPVLAICRGHQVVNVWAGGDLVQDLGPLVPFHQGHEGDRVHPVRAAEGSLLHALYGPVFSVNSCHHQGVGHVGHGLRVTAWSEGGVIEAIEHETLPLISLQFHPERLTGLYARPDAVDGAPIFARFAALCGLVNL